MHSLYNDLAVQRRISQSTVKLIESDGAQWVTHGVPYTTMDLPHDNENLAGEDVGQILILLGRFVKNVEKPKIILPRSCIGSYGGDDLGKCWTKKIEQLMTDRGKDEDIIDEYELLEDYIDTEVLELKYATGRKSKALLERKYGRVVFLQYDHLEDLKRQ